MTEHGGGGVFWSRIRGHFKATFISGLLVLVPLLVTLWVLGFIIQTMDNIFLPFVLKPFFPNDTLPSHYYGLGAVFTVAIVVLVGAFARGLLAGRMVHFGEGLIARIPFVRSVYGSVKQLLATVLQTGHREFRRVALVPFPHPEVYSVGFVTGVASGEVQEKTQERVINVFIPTTPNPTTGFFIMVPEEKMIPLEMTVEEAFRLIMSGGIATSPAGAVNAGGRPVTAIPAGVGVAPGGTSVPSA